jgi:hypothetical protein
LRMVSAVIFLIPKPPPNNNFGRYLAWSPPRIYKNYRN